MDELGVRPTFRAELIRRQAELAQLRGRADEAWRRLAAADEIERDIGRDTKHPFEVPAVMLVRGGRYEDARAALAPFVAEIKRRGNDWEATVALCWLTLAEVRLGNLDAACAAAIALRDRQARGGWYEPRARTHLVLSEVRLAEGDLESAVAEAREAVEIAETGDWVLLAADVRLMLARALHAAGDAAAAAPQAQVGARLYKDKGYVAAAADAETLLGTLAVPRS